MHINIKATGFELTPAISDYVNKKISTIEKYLDKVNEDTVVQVEVGRNTQHKSGRVYKAEVHITGNGLDIYAVTEEEDLYAAVDTVRDEVIHNIVQSKGKRETLTRRSARAVKNIMKGISDTTAKGFSWSWERIKFKGFRGFKKRP